MKFIYTQSLYLHSRCFLTPIHDQTNKQKRKSHTQTQQISLTKLSLINDLQSKKYATNNSLYKQSEGAENGIFQSK